MPNQKPNTAFPISLGFFARYQNNTKNPRDYAKGIPLGDKKGRHLPPNSEQLSRSDTSSSSLSSLNGNEPKILAGEAENKREQQGTQQGQGNGGIILGEYKAMMLEKIIEKSV